MPILATVPVKLRSVVFPVFEFDGEHIVRFLGTCFALHGNPTVIVSAAHVFKGCRSDKICLLLRDVDDQTYPMVGSSWSVNNEHDLAFINLVQVPARIGALPLAANMVGTTDPVFTFEFSPTVPRKTETGLKFTPNAYTHVGNIVTHHYAVTDAGVEYSRRFETSFPALRGASGAPVMDVANSAVLGVLIRNHTLPLADEGSLNFGEAVSLEAFEQALAKCGVLPTRVVV